MPALEQGLKCRARWQNICSVDDNFPDLYTPETTASIIASAHSLAGMGVPIWTGGLTPEALVAQCKFGDDIAVHLFRRALRSPSFTEYADWGRKEFELLAHRARSCPPPYLALAFPERQTELFTRHQHFALRGLLGHAFGIRNLVVGTDARPVPTGDDGTARELCGDRVAEWRRHVVELLRTLDAPEDTWHQHSLLAFLLSPGFAREILNLPFWLNPEVDGQPPITRQAATAMGSVDEVERAAVRVKSRWQRDHGFQPPRKRPGPRPGKPRRPNPRREAFDRYVTGRRASGVSPQGIATDAEALRLYRAFRGDHAASLNERIVQAVLRRREGGR